MDICLNEFIDVPAIGNSLGKRLVPIELPLPKRLRKERWKVKIREKETRETPHVSILRGTNTWRINLRTGEFMDKRPNPSAVPEELLDLIREEKTWQWICQQWDDKYPENPVISDEKDDDQHDTADSE